jgi:hypothetical protein
LLRLRYRHGVYIDLRGYPDWQPYAAALVTVPDPAVDLSSADLRLFRVTVASQLVSAWVEPDATIPGGAPSGWVWAHLGRSRTMALVPAELHGAFRHRGGVGDHGVETTSPEYAAATGTVPIRPTRRLATDALDKFEGWLGYRLPEAYRDFLAATNGGRPAQAAVPAGSRFVVDQPLFGLATEDRMQDLAYANLWFRDRLSPDFLATGYVQGGLLVLRVRGDGAGSVWHWDDDDRRDDERYGSDVICRDLLRPGAADFAEFRSRLAPIPPGLTALADQAIASGTAALIRSDALGAALPRSRRPPWISRLAAVAQPDPSAPLL